jgi:hypothetical protein
MREHVSLKCMVELVVTPFMLEAHSPQRAVGRVAAPEPSSAGRWGLEPWDAWQCWSPPQWGGRIQSRGAHGRARALLGRV